MVELEECEQTLKRIEADREPLLARLQELSDEQKVVQYRIWELKYGLVIGCIVERRGKRYKVASISNSFDPPWAYGLPIKKDGTIGGRKLWISGDWKVVKP